jgi:GTP cyclohydrolase II
MPLPLPTATIRTHVSMPLRFADGYATAARVFSFDGLVDGQANLALGHREDERSYLVAAQMLQALGVLRVALLSNNPDKARQLRRFGVTVTARVPTAVHLSAANGHYLATKAGRGAHTLDVPPSAG